MKLREWLASIHACKAGVSWVERDETPTHAMARCHRADFIAWMLGAMDARLGVRAACAAIVTETYSPLNERVWHDCLAALMSFGMGTADARLIHVWRREAHRVDPAHPITWACVAATAATDALRGEAASIACDQAATRAAMATGVDKYEVSAKQADAIRAAIQPAEVRQAWKRVNRRYR